MLVPPAHSQISLTTAVDLALRNNPRVQSAEADVARAQAQVEQARDVYIPSITAGAGLGQAYGYLPYPPTLATVNAGSLVFGASQFFYIRSAHAGMEAARLSLNDVREAVIQDTALSYIALDHDQQRSQAIQQQMDYANSLLTIVHQRLDAGQDSQIDLTQAKLTVAQFHLADLKSRDDVANDREHLARLIGLPPDTLKVDNSFPSSPMPLEATDIRRADGYANSAVASAFASAEARRLQARGDARYRFWPQINLFAQYNRYATFTNSFKDLEKVYENSNGQTLLTSNETAFGVQISIPFFDRSRDAKARETAANANKEFHDAQSAEIDALDSQGRLRHSIDELRAQEDVATLTQQLAQQQLDILHIQLESGTGNPNGPQMTPKNEQTARIDERDKYLAVLDANFQVRQTEIQLMRQIGSLETWLKAAVHDAPGTTVHNNTPPTPTPQP